MDSETSNALVKNMASYKKCVEELSEANERSKQHLQLVRDMADQDMQPLRDRIDELKNQITYALNEYNEGRKFSVPGLGTAFITKRTTTKVVDEDALLKAFKRDGVDTSGMYTRVVDAKAVRDALKAAMEETGEIPDGVEVQTNSSLSFRGS